MFELPFLLHIGRYSMIATFFPALWNVLLKVGLNMGRKTFGTVDERTFTLPPSS